MELDRFLIVVPAIFVAMVLLGILTTAVFATAVLVATVFVLVLVLIVLVFHNYSPFSRIQKRTPFIKLFSNALERQV